MLDFFIIFNRGGIVLWRFQEMPDATDGSAVSELVADVLLEGRGKETTFLSKTNQVVKYRLDNERSLVFAAVYQKSFDGKLAYVDPLLLAAHRKFTAKFGDDVNDALAQTPFEFDQEFRRLRTAIENDLKTKKTVMRDFSETKKFQTTLQHNEELQGRRPVSKPTVAVEEDGDDVDDEDEGLHEGETQAERTARILKSKGSRKARGKSKSPSKSTGKSPGKSPSAKPVAIPRDKKSKENRQWTVGGQAKVDYSQGGQATDEQLLADMASIRDLGAMKGDISEMVYESDEEEDLDELLATKDAKAQSGWFSSVFSNLAGNTITEEALEPVLEKMRLHLVSKNVASEIAAKLCDSVGQTLVGKSKSTFKGLQSIVKESLEAQLTRILSPNRRVDVLRDVMTANESGRPFTVVFCGVNGVGKSTNLAKICYWLNGNDKRVLIAACDTFRAGAVEQLRTHVRKLNVLHGEGSPMVKLFEQGYGKDDATIAQAAIRMGHQEGHNVVLVDTAGRMQDNEPLMRSLAKLIKINNPDLVLFVGEALVGNEAVDQLAKFNKALADYSDVSNPRLIDGIVLSKFDTIDDKVGAAISMTYTSGQPILFVGTGQDYTDVRKLNVKTVVQALMR